MDLVNFLSMEYFAAVADKRNFTRAADQLHITQQTLSAHIASLERELNCQLFLRRSPLELTYAGQVFLRYALQFQQDYQALKHEFCDITANQRGLLRVGIAYTRGRVIMPRVIPAFQTVYPNIQVDLIEASNDELHARLLDGTVDLAVAAFAHSVPEIELQPFYQEEVCMLVPQTLLPLLEYTPPEGPLAPKDLAAFRSCPFALGIPEDIAGQLGRRLIKAAGFHPIVRAQSENMETLLALCAQGVGISFCPDVLASAALSQGSLDGLKVFRFQEDSTYAIRFGYRCQPYQWSMISEFIRVARSVFPDPACCGRLIHASQSRITE